MFDIPSLNISRRENLGADEFFSFFFLWQNQPSSIRLLSLLPSGSSKFSLLVCCLLFGEIYFEKIRSFSTESLENSVKNARNKGLGFLKMRNKKKKETQKACQTEKPSDSWVQETRRRSILKTFCCSKEREGRPSCVVVVVQSIDFLVGNSKTKSEAEAVCNGVFL